MNKTKVAIAGFGTIGRALARHLVQLSAVELTCVASGDSARARSALGELGLKLPVVAAAELPAHADVVLECAPAAAFSSIARPVLQAGKTLVTVSAAALLENFDVVDLARERGGRLVLATGALLGLDAVRAAALGATIEVKMVTRKPPASLESARYVVENGISLDGLEAPKLIFKGSAREGALAFPANVNVAATLALAGPGPDRTELEIWADPALTRNTHRIFVEADTARFEMFIENVPSTENPATGRITALSMLAALQSLYTPFRVGS